MNPNMLIVTNYEKWWVRNYEGIFFEGLDSSEELG